MHCLSLAASTYEGLTRDFPPRPLAGPTETALVIVGLDPDEEPTLPTLEEFCTIRATMAARMMGRAPGGGRIDFPFEGVATGPHWEGERPVRGIDYATVRGDGNMDLDIHAAIGEKRETVAYRGSGVSIVDSPTSALPKELITFQTGNEDLAWLNTAVGVGLGRGEGSDISLTIYVVKP